MAFLIELGATHATLPADLDARTDALQVELDKLDNIIDPDLLVNLRTGEVIAEMIVDVDDAMEAAWIASCALRTAFHAIGYSTQDWNRLFESFNSKTEPTELLGA